MRPSLDIVIVNWNAGAQLRDCLKSIESARCNIFTLSRVVVVDNASNDDSLDNLDSLRLPLVIIRNSVNRGFGAACNQGATVCDARYLLFLNPDTKVFKNSLVVPLEFMEDAEKLDVGICGVQLINEKGRVTRTCARFPSLRRFVVQAIGLNKFPGLKALGVRMDEWDHLHNKSVDQVVGAFFFTRRSVFEALKGFDKRFFVYYEEVDFSLRARKAGWITEYLIDAQAFHRGGGTSRQMKETRLFYSLRSRLLYGFKHFPRWQAWLLTGVTMIIEPLSRSVFSMLRGGVRDVRNTWMGYSLLYRDIPDILGNSRDNYE